MKRVLIVNRDNKSARVLASALKQNGYTVRHLQTSNDALHFSDQVNPDIVILHNFGIITDEAQAAKMILHPNLNNAIFVFVAEIIIDNKIRELNTRCDVIGSHYAVYPKPIKVRRLLKEIRRW